jgi:hypothetical protein
MQLFEDKDGNRINFIFEASKHLYVVIYKEVTVHSNIKENVCMLSREFRS